MSISIESWSSFCESFISISNVSDSMEWCYFFGCTLIALSAPLALLVFIIGPKPQLIVVSISRYHHISLHVYSTVKRTTNHKNSSIFYLFAIMINSVIWKLLPFLESSNTIFIMLSVLIIEMMRPIYFNYFNTARRSFRTVSTNRVIFPLDDLTSSIAAGYGWGTVHIFIYYIPYVAKSIGPGTYFNRAECEMFSVVTKASWFSHCVFLQHVFLMIIFYDAISKKSNVQWWFAVFLHLLSSLWNELNMHCLITIIGQFIMSIALGIWTWHLIHRPKFRRKLKQL